ncbi:hypothetical protein [Enterovirga rhinocerotis]|uniref:hypothetical protein n=1 Tax=Enterovirga rhinocerotis TaxID=1339210 RepID=UPI001061F8A2|nr:hypothetical protein [Enterovirga rhinocerotis]
MEPPPTGREAELAEAVEALRRRLASGPPMAPAELRREVDAIADLALALQGGADPAVSPPKSSET